MNPNLQYIAQVCSDFAATLAPSARGPFIQASQQAIDAIKAAMSQPLPSESANVPSP